MIRRKQYIKCFVDRRTKPTQRNEWCTTNEMNKKLTTEQFPSKRDRNNYYMECGKKNAKWMSKTVHVCVCVCDTLLSCLYGDLTAHSKWTFPTRKTALFLPLSYKAREKSFAFIRQTCSIIIRIWCEDCMLSIILIAFNLNRIFDKINNKIWRFFFFDRLIFLSFVAGLNFICEKLCYMRTLSIKHKWLSEKLIVRRN